MGPPFTTLETLRLLSLRYSIPVLLNFVNNTIIKVRVHHFRLGSFEDLTPIQSREPAKVCFLIQFLNLFFKNQFLHSDF